MAETIQSILLPRIRKINLWSKTMLDPADFHSGLPKIKLPEINENGLVLSLESHKVGTAKMTATGSMKINVCYNAQVLSLIDKYIEVRVIDDYEPEWLGDFFGIPVKGSGGQGTMRGCRVLGFERNCLRVEGVSAGGNPGWLKLSKKIQRLLQLSN